MHVRTLVLVWGMSLLFLTVTTSAFGDDRATCGLDAAQHLGQQDALALEPLQPPALAVGCEGVTINALTAAYLDGYAAALSALANQLRADDGAAQVKPNCRWQLAGVPDIDPGCNVYGCWEYGGGCNVYGCWTDGGGCNVYGCWNSPAGDCNVHGCSAVGACNVHGCPSGEPDKTYACE